MPGALTFSVPWVLAALLALPALWWLLRMVPPSPRRQDFPAIALLAGLVSAERVAARTPPWLIALRLLLFTLVVLGLAHPVIGGANARFDGPLLLVVDNGWAAAKSWPEREQAIVRLLDRAEREGRAVALLATAPPADGGAVAATALMTAAQAKGLALALKPQPWAADRAAAAKAAAGLSPPMEAVWIGDGLDSPGAEALALALNGLGRLEMLLSPEPARLLRAADSGEAAITVARAAAGVPETLAVRALDGAGRVLARESLTLGSAARQGRAAFSLPTELRNRVERFDIEGEETAGATLLLDERFRRRPAGLIERGAAPASPLLDDLFYAERALAPLAEVRRGPLDELLRREMSLLVLPDGGALGAGDVALLERWVGEGGILLRLAGPKLAGTVDPLLPVALRAGGRNLGGAMSWTQPMAVAPMPETGPFAGLPVPADLTIQSQVLAEPSIDLAEKSWARLSDGTPLVTAAPRGKGWVVLIHTTIGPAWSNLGLSGLFPDMLGRLLALGRGYAQPAAASHALAPVALMDGFGRLLPPAGLAEALAPGIAVSPGPRHPPGYYGAESSRFAFNLSSSLEDPSPQPVPAGAARRMLGGRDGEIDLKPWLLAGAALLLLADMVAVLALKGLLGRRSALGLAAFLLLSGLASGDGRAAESGKALAAALDTRLAYVLTGDSRIDEVSRAGLRGLTTVLAQRSTAVLAEPDAVDLDRDTLMVYPLLYWPITPTQAPLSAAAVERVNDFLRRGGMILIDTQDRGEGGPGLLRRLAGGLDIPVLAPVGPAHVLTHTFYLMEEFPGRWMGAPLFAAAGEDAANDNVSPVVVGSNDWAGAWALGANGGALFPVVPGGEMQRELAYRFGINLVMYALTGSYKADQVHFPALLERMRR